MKKRLLLIGIIALILITAGLGINYILSLQKVTFDLDSETESVKIFTSDNREISQLTSDDYITLREGSYYYVPEGANITSDKTDFSVEKKDITIKITPSFNEDYLSRKLKEEDEEIKSALTAKYPDIFSNYTLAQGVLYGQGEWYGALLKPKVSDPRDIRDPYRVILKNEAGGWKVVRRPEYVLTASRFKDVPVEILRKINALVGVPGS